jgi:hypothetical protein
MEEEEDGTDKCPPPEIYKKIPNSWVCLFFDLITCMLCHVSTDSGVCLSEIVLISLNRTISTHWNEFVQNWWFFAISSNTDGSKYFPRKCDGFLKLTPQTESHLVLPEMRWGTIVEFFFFANFAVIDLTPRC